MARGQQKIQAQQKNAAKQAKLKKQKEKKGNKPLQLEGQQCKICLTMITSLGSSVTKLEEHWNGKHSKKTVEECFPCYPELKVKADAALKAKDDKQSGATMDGSKNSGTGKKSQKTKKKKKNDMSELEASMAAM